MSEAGANELKKDALGLPSALAMSLAFISPTIGVIFISALIGSQAGVASPFVFLLGTIGLALMASTIAQFASRVTSAGGFYKFIALGLGDRAGFTCGMALLFAYALLGPGNSNLFGGFVSHALYADFGVSVPWWVLSTFIITVVGVLGWYSVHASMQFDIVFLIAEIIIAGFLLTLIVVQGGEAGHVPTAFTPVDASNGWGGMGKAFVFVVLAFLGFESCLTVAEETKNPRRSLPIAIVGSVTIAGLFFTFAMYATVIGFGADNMDGLAASSEPLRDLAERYMGHWYAVLIDMSAFSAIIAVLLASQTTIFRVLYALGRDGLLPRALGRTHPKYKTPHIAIICYSLATLAVGLIMGGIWGPINAFGNFGYLSSLAMLLVYIVTNIALPFFIRKHYPDEFSVVLHVLFPAISGVIFCFGLYFSVNPWPEGAIANFPYVVMALIVSMWLWGSSVQKRKPELFSKLGGVVYEESIEKPVLETIEPHHGEHPQTKTIV